MPDRTRHNRFALLCLLVLSLCCASCEAPDFAAYVIAGPPKIKAQYKLQPRQTLVIVDDPQNVLGDLNYPTVVAANVNFHLNENEVLLPEQIISQDHLTVLAANMGDRYRSTPIDEIGKRLKADQVIYVLIRSVDLTDKNTYYEPTAHCDIKIIDVQTGKRLFPAPPENTVAQPNAPGHALTVTIDKQTVDRTRRHAMSNLARALSERIGLEVAGLFFDHVDFDYELVS